MGIIKHISLKSISLFACALLFFSVSLNAQQPGIHEAPNKKFSRAMELLDKEKYAEAQHLFDELREELKDDNSEMSVMAEYNAALCAMNLYHKDSRYRMENFIQDHSESSKVRTAFYDLGSYYYRRKKYKTALEWFEKVNLQPIITILISTTKRGIMRRLYKVLKP